MPFTQLDIIDFDPPCPQMCSSSLKRLVTFDHGGHNDTWQSRGYYDAWTHFHKEVALYYANKNNTSATAYYASEPNGGDNNGQTNASTTDLNASDSFTLLMPQPPEHIFEPQ